MDNLNEDQTTDDNAQVPKTDEILEFKQSCDKTADVVLSECMQPKSSPDRSSLYDSAVSNSYSESELLLNTICSVCADCEKWLNSTLVRFSNQLNSIPEQLDGQFSSIEDGLSEYSTLSRSIHVDYCTYVDWVCSFQQT